MTNAKSIRLTDLQLVLLSNAAAHDDGSLLPFPEGCASDTSRIRKSAGALLKRDLVAEMPVTDPQLGWRTEADATIGLFITGSGRAAIGLTYDTQTEDETGQAESTITETTPPTSPRPGSKIGIVVTLLERETGATLDEMVAATGWQPHTTRAALTGLRNKGRTIDKTKRDNATCYRIMVEA